MITCQIVSKTRLSAIIFLTAAILSPVASIADEPDCVTDSGLDELRGVINDSCAYENILDVVYDVHVTCDQRLDTSQTVTKPNVTFSKKIKTVDFLPGLKIYTLLMVDLDSRGSSVEDLEFYLHWAVSFIEEKQLKTGTFPKALEGYEQPRIKGHRYFFIVFEGRHLGISIWGSRNVFRMEDFLKRYNLCSYVAVFQFNGSGTKKCVFVVFGLLGILYVV